MAERPTQRPVVVCRSLTKVFKDFWLRAKVRAVEDVSFEIQPGEIFGLLGPNGSGKSTTIKIILGLLRPTRGQVVVFGRPPTDVGIKGRIGYLPEESYLYPFLNARETLAYYGKLFGLDHRTRERRIDELLDMVGLTAVQFRPVREYSKGMQRRIGIAQALINDPELLILDEPTTGLDPIGTRQIKDLILELGRRGKTVILSSHLLADVEDCVTRMVIYYGGKIREQGTCRELLEDQDKSVLEFDRLDEATIEAIDRLVRQRTGGQRALERVVRPRQRLEDLFIEIVERARAERLATAGAQHGGQTAAFLRAGPVEATGAAVIENLLVAEPTGPAAPPPTERPPETPADESVISSLVDVRATPAPLTRARGPEPGPEADLGVIGALLDHPEDAPASGTGPAPHGGAR
ncbi:MAG TPA: ABC transporter ATP-binding protein [Phycisphaerales bacterium]|nr:ABC transporter ATP-binding protein [Phycisphaerales bacterium]